MPFHPLEQPLHASSKVSHICFSVDLHVRHECLKYNIQRVSGQISSHDYDIVSIRHNVNSFMYASSTYRRPHIEQSTRELS